MDTPVFKIRNDLIEAYKGYYEDERTVVQNDGSFKQVIDFTKEEWEIWITWRILTDQPAERLERYCEWNGILGYSTTLFDIATGKLS